MVEISEIKGRAPIDMAVGVSNFETAYAMTMHLAREGLPADRLRLDADPRQRPAAAAPAPATMRRSADLGVAHEDMEVEVPITPRGGAEALVTLTDRHPDIDAIFFSSDTLAVGAIQECHRRGWAVPGRIAIAGYGDMDLAAAALPRR